MSTSTSTSTPKGPFRLVTVNTAPERAKKLIGRLVENLKDQYTIEYVANCETMEEVAAKVSEFQPDVLFSASMWTREEAAEIRSIAQCQRPGITTYAIPEGLQVKYGPDAVVEHLMENVPPLLDQIELRGGESGESG